MSHWRAACVVFQKEVVDGLRDRRSLTSLGFSAIIAPLLFGLIFTVAAERRRSAEDVSLPVAGAEHAPAFVAWLRQQTGVVVVRAPADPEQAVRDRKEAVVLIIEPGFERDLARAVPARVRLVSDATREGTRPAVARVRSLVATWSQLTGAQRLIARGVAPSVATALRIEDVEVSNAQQRLATQLGILPLLLVIAALTGGMQIAIDATAGERERGSLEPLLLSPVSRQAIATGKWLAASAFSCGAVVFSLLLTIAVMRRVPWHDLGLRFTVSDASLLSILVIVLPAAVALSAFVLFASTFARSFKEAQSYLGMLMLIPMIPGLIGTVYPLSNRPWLAPVPLLGQYALAADVLGGGRPSLLLQAVASAAALAVALGLVAATARLLGREHIIFGR
jgi:sodium transport system permease protein